MEKTAGSRGKGEDMRKKWIFGIVCILCAVGLAMGFGADTAHAAFEASVEAAYNLAVQGQDALDGLDVTVQEKTVAAGTNISSRKKVDLQVTGIKSDYLKADIQVDTDEGREESYYRKDSYYTTSSEGKVKRPMDRADLWEMINSHIYLDMTSNYLKMLCSETAADGMITYRFAGTAETLGDYTKKLLAGAREEQGFVIDSLQGTMVTDPEGHVQERSISMVYTVKQGEKEETFLVQTEASFHQNGESVTVALPDLSEYKEPEPEKPVETITALVRTVYVTDDVNVRAAGNLSAAILGGFSAGSGVTQTGYTSDGWIQVQYNEGTGYVWGDYVSTKKPVITRDGSGTMYATADVNIREQYSSDSAVLGVLSKGSGVEITGTTDNGWIRVKYNGRTGYVFADYLSWSEPVTVSYVRSGYLSGTVEDASFGTLVIDRDDGQGLVLFDTTYAVMNLQDTIYYGDWVEIYYEGAGAPYTATQVNDPISHEDAGEEQGVFTEGIVSSCKGNKLELSGSDGIYRTFDISDADLEMADRPVKGQYVTVFWMSRTNGTETKNITAYRVMG